MFGNLPKSLVESVAKRVAEDANNSALFEDILTAYGATCIEEISEEEQYTFYEEVSELLGEGYTGLGKLQVKYRRKGVNPKTKAGGKRKFGLKKEDWEDRQKEKIRDKAKKEGRRAKETDRKPVDEEPLDEISKNLAGNYIKKSTNDARTFSRLQGKSDAKKKDSKEWQAGAWKRQAGVERATDKLTGKAKVSATEEKKNLDEISRGLASRYIKKASSSLTKSVRTADKSDYGPHYDTPETDKAGDTAEKRMKGIHTATDKIHGFAAKVTASDGPYSVHHPDGRVTHHTNKSSKKK